MFTKLLVLRLSTLISRIFSSFQSDFIPDRVIYDNVLLVQKFVHDLNHHSRVNNMVLKLDMAKAYD